MTSYVGPKAPLSEASADALGQGRAACAFVPWRDVFASAAAEGVELRIDGTHAVTERVVPWPPDAPYRRMTKAGPGSLARDPRNPGSAHGHTRQYG